jgi:exodeoxyribonuclease-5
MALTQHQQEVMEGVATAIKQGVKRVVVKGSAGVGKTYMVNQLIMYLKNYLRGGLVCISAPTHKALSVLFSKVKLDEGVHMNLEFRTIHSALQLERYFEEDGRQIFKRKPYNPRFPPLDRVRLIVLDEASMVNSELIKYLDEFPGIPVIFIGDDKQLNPVGEPISPIFAKGYPEFELTEIIRQGEGNPIIDLSRNIPAIKSKQSVITENGLGYTYTYDKNRIIDRLAEVNGTDEFKYLSYTNTDVDSINKQVREKIYGNPNKIELGETLVFKAPFKEYHVSDELLVKSLEIIEQDYYVPNHLTNIKKGKMGIEILTSYDVDTDSYIIMADKVKLKVYIINGNIPVVHEDSEKQFKKIVSDLRAKCKAKSVSWLGFYWFTELFADLTYNHALTVHKSQGSTYKKAVINIANININQNPEEKQRLLYTAVTRASDLVVLYNVR